MCVLFSLCIRLGDVFVFIVECSVLMSRILSRCDRMVLCVGCCLYDFFCMSCMIVFRCCLLWICMSFGSSDISSVEFGEVKL